MPSEKSLEKEDGSMWGNGKVTVLHPDTLGRQQSDKPPANLFHSYLHGIMDGEVIKAVEEEGIGLSYNETIPSPFQIFQIK
jgi:hypothetical protein